MSKSLNLHKSSYNIKIISLKFYEMWYFNPPYNPAVVLLDLHPNELKSYIHTKTCTWMFIAAFVIITQTWKQARYALVGKWRKLRYLL